MNFWSRKEPKAQKTPVFVLAFQGGPHHGETRIHPGPLPEHMPFPGGRYIRTSRSREGAEYHWEAA